MAVTATPRASSAWRLGNGVAASDAKAARLDEASTRHNTARRAERREKKPTVITGQLRYCLILLVVKKTIPVSRSTACEAHHRFSARPSEPRARPRVETFKAQDSGAALALFHPTVPRRSLR